jgi:hypothetical protein
VGDNDRLPDGALSNELHTIGQTPLPGLRLEILEEVETTPVAIHQVLTDREGRPRTSVEVDSASEITIQSLDSTIARLAVAGPAAEFAAHSLPALIVTPMLAQATPCLLTENGTPSVQFNYTNFNTPEETVMVGITSLRPDLRGTPDDPEDDLHLNSIVDSSGTPIVPDATYRVPSPNDQEQVFSESASFLIPFDFRLGSVKWTLLGTEVAVDGSTQLCRDEGLIACQPVPISGLRSLTEYAQVTVAKYLQAATRQARNPTKFKGAKSYLKSAATFYRETKNVIVSLEGTTTCPPNTMVAVNRCEAASAYESALIARIHALFGRKNDKKNKVFVTLQRTLTSRYQQLIRKTLPPSYLVCR